MKDILCYYHREAVTVRFMSLLFTLSEMACNKLETVLFEGTFSLMSWGPFPKSPENFLGPKKPVLVNQYFKTERCLRLKLLVLREPLFILRICA